MSAERSVRRGLGDSLAPVAYTVMSDGSMVFASGAIFDVNGAPLAALADNAAPECEILADGDIVIAGESSTPPAWWFLAGLVLGRIIGGIL